MRFAHFAAKVSALKVNGLDPDHPDKS